MGVRKYITAFPGARDAYQLPYALSKNGRLDVFVTDFYNKPWLNQVPVSRGKELLKRRQHENDLIPHASIVAYPFLSVSNSIMKAFADPAKSSVITDELYSRIAACLARRKKSNLFLYEFQAEWAFKQKYVHNPKKIVFYFHPHPSFEHPLLLRDAKMYPDFLDDVFRNTRAAFSPRYQNHTKSAWQYSDHIFVASSFTKKSLCEQGAKEENVTVVPYGVSSAEVPSPFANDTAPYFLYVASGIHRKGLHHLLEAWVVSGLSSKAKLIVVARNAEPYNEQLLLNTQNVVWKKGVSRKELVELYSGAALFVLPSLSEGFGQVYIEALSFGCPVLGTNHSVLSDIKGYDDVIYKVEPGNIEELSSCLKQQWDIQPGRNIALRKRASEIKGLFTWSNFQDTIEAKLREID